MNKNIKVSVITPCLNSEKTIRDTIEHVLHQTYPNIEYIMVDGASTDSTVEIIKEYEPLFHGRMRWISEKDRGIYNAMNKGIKMSTGQLIGIINSDDYYELDAVEKVVSAVSDDKYQVLYGYLRVWDKKGRSKVSIASHENLKNEMIPHPTCFLKRAVYVKYGLYWEHFKVVADYDLMLRLHGKKDVTFTMVKNVIANFRIGGKSYEPQYYIERNLVKLKHGIIDTNDIGNRIHEYLGRKIH